MSWNKVPGKSFLPWLILLGLSGAYNDLSGQYIGGIFVEKSDDAGTKRDGFGGELGIKVAFLPIEVFGSGAHFPAVQQDESFRVWSLGARAKIVPIPLLNPYLVGGLSLKKHVGGDSGITSSEDGYFGGIGINATLKSFKVYAESKYEVQGTSSITFRLGASLLWGRLRF